MIFLKDLFHNKAEFRNLCTSEITRKCRNSWSFLPIPELQISHGWRNDQLQSLNKCKAEFQNLCTSGITRKCRNSCLFRNYKYLILTNSRPHPHTLNLCRNRQELAGLPGHSTSMQFRNSKKELHLYFHSKV